MTHECDKVRIGAIEALEYILNRTDLNLLAPGLGDKDSAVRARTVIAIWKNGEFSICDSLKTMLDKDDLFTQLSASEVLSKIGLMLRNLEFEPNTKNLLEALRAHPAYGRN
jgi:HEAT repeat protein